MEQLGHGAGMEQGTGVTEINLSVERLFLPLTLHLHVLIIEDSELACMTVLYTELIRLKLESILARLEQLT